MSFGFEEDDIDIIDFKQAVTAARNAGVIMVAAAGNVSDDHTSPYYGLEYVTKLPAPARWDGVIAVGASSNGATLRDELKSPYSICDSLDECKLHIVSPVNDYTSGINMHTTYYNDNYKNDFSGTSAACPTVVGVIANILTINPGLTYTQIEAILAKTAEKIGGYLYLQWYYDTRSLEVGYGRLNAYEALKYTVENYGGTFNSDVTIATGEVFDLEPGVTLKFDPNVSLIVEGTLIAQGNSNDHITFTSSQTTPQKGDWDWIKFDNSSGTSILEYCDIEYAKFGIWGVSNSHVSMDNVTVTNCQNYGLYLLNNSTNTSVENSNFTHNNTYGIFLYNSDPDIVYATCTNNSDGLCCYNNSNPAIGFSVFSNNNYDGIYCYNTGYVWMYYNATYFPNRGWNTIQSNNSRGVSAYSSSYPFLGFSSICPGNNTIKNNSSYEVYNGNSSGYIYARYNWWESSTPDLYTSQTVLIDDPLNQSSALLTGLSKPMIDNHVINSTSKSIPEEYNRLATAFLMEGNYEKARGLFQYVFENYPDSEEAKYALVHITACFDQLNERSNVVPFLEGVSESYSKLELSGFALALSVPYLESAGKYSQAVERCLQVREFSKDEEVNKNMLFILANIYFYGLQDADKAKLYFEEYIKSYPKDPMTKTAQDMLEIMDHGFIPKRDHPENAQANDSPTTFALSQNYPNPFNPETEISFQLPEDVHVTLSIFNLLGQKVRTIIDKQMATGYHTIQWDGRNDFGNSVASGVYLYVIQAGKFYDVKKMVLMR